MANRRMFSMTIIDTDHFLELPDSSQVLYFHLAMRADDDGFISSPKRIARMIGAADDDLRLLINKEFIIPFESGVCVITHWKIHNYIRKDRYAPTFHKMEKSQLGLTENKSYTTDPSQVEEWVTEGIPSVDQVSYQRLPQDRIDKDRLEIGKVRLDCLFDADKKPNKQTIDNFIKNWNDNRVSNQINTALANNYKNEFKRILDIYEIEDLFKAVRKISESKYLINIISLDWFLKKENFTKVLAGEYSDYFYDEIKRD